VSHPTIPRSVELLAPAGGFDSLRAAVRNGADAVYLGTTELNARRGAENFTLETLAEACRFAHLRGARVYLTATGVVLEHEMRPALARTWG
jgi:putative protease